MRNTSIGAEVLVVIDGKATKGSVTESFGEGAARIDLGKNGSIQTNYSPTGEEGTFHYPDEKISKTESKPNPAAAAPASSAKSA